jgi:hypothetical protein
MSLVLYLISEVNTRPYISPPDTPYADPSGPSARWRLVACLFVRAHDSTSGAFPRAGATSRAQYIMAYFLHLENQNIKELGDRNENAKREP